MDGWIKLHRKLLDWEWYDDVNTKCLFIHLLLRANHEPKKWRGHAIGKGEVLTGRKKLAEELGLGEQAIRTSLSKLKSTNEVTIKTTKEYSLIKINNWEVHQVANQQPNQQPTNNQPTTNHKQEGEEGKNEKKREYSPNSSIKILKDKKTLEDLKRKFPNTDIPGEVEKMIDWLTAKGKVQRDYVAFARNWLRRSSASDRLGNKRKGMIEI